MGRDLENYTYDGQPRNSTFMKAPPFTSPPANPVMNEYYYEVWCAHLMSKRPDSMLKSDVIEAENAVEGMKKAGEYWTKTDGVVIRYTIRNFRKI